MKKALCYMLLLLPIFYGCNESWKRQSTINDNDRVSINRFDRLLDNYVTYNKFSMYRDMTTQYPQETRLLVEDVLSVGKMNDPSINDRLRAFCLDPTVQILMRSVRTKYSDMSKEEHLFSKAFKQLRKAVPSSTVPVIYTQVSALNQSIVVGDGILGISLDKYLGRDYPLYKKFYYEYQSRSMSRDRIVPDALSFYLMDTYPIANDSRPHTVMDRILHIGKINWIVYKLLDMKSVDDAIGFSKQRSSWCMRHRMQIDNYLKDLNVWHATDSLTFSVVMLPHEDTPALGQGSPDAVGAWFGVHVFASYMEAHPNVTIEQLLVNDNYQQFFADSGFMD